MNSAKESRLRLSSVFSTVILDQLMATTIIYGDKASQIANASAHGDNLWLPIAALPAVTGWEFKPQGFCRDELCLPIPAGREAEFLARNDSVNLSSFAGLLGQPVAHDDAHAVWFFGEPVGKRRDDLLSGKAPDFTLPDLDGKMHSLSDYAGRKVLLLSWASW
jgi:AhpC/TSA family